MCVCVCVWLCMSVLRFLVTSHEVVRRRYTSPVVTVSLVAKSYPIFWYIRPLCDENWRFLVEGHDRQHPGESSMSWGIVNVLGSRQAPWIFTVSLKWAQVDPVSCPDLTALNNQMGPQDIRKGCNQIRNWANQNLFNISYFEPCLVFLSGKKIMLKKFVRKYTKMSVFSCILFWDINFENPLNRFKAAMFF